MTKGLLYWLLPSLILLGCAKEERPADVLGKAKMVDVMVDVHLAEGIEKTTILTLDSTIISGQAVYDFLYEKHGITEEEYTRSFEWYSEHLKEFDEVYARVIEKLNQMEATRQQIRDR
ncbi:DUF4296 domain-containing protein [Cryomorphaceae bacterium]|nr:DUF4296 domain-containing protein [Cryomorphaceae bacterium]